MASKPAYLGHGIGDPRRPPGPESPAALADPAQDYKRLFRAIPIPLVLVDPASLHIAAVNPAATRALGFSEAECLASSLLDLVSGADRDTLLHRTGPAPVPGLIEARSSWTVRRRDGSGLRLEVAGTGVQFAGGPHAVLFQPTDPEPSAHQVGASGAALPGFSFSALHDLKEPLHLVRGYLSLLRSKAAPGLDPESREFLEYAYSGTQRMQAIVLDLLEYFRVDARRIAAEPVDLEAELADSIDALRLQVEEAKAVVTHGPLPRVLADRVQVARLLQNLLSNALKFRSSTPPRIHVSALPAGTMWDVSVKDNGIGIAAKDQERVLQPFQRVHSSDQYAGTGLGLSICRKIAELHGGRLWIVSSLGQGTEVHFTLPAQEAPA
jgi:PAS domain S-box-containing protein